MNLEIREARKDIDVPYIAVALVELFQFNSSLSSCPKDKGGG
jgi:hypothetical protein